jgi:predicted peptidase
MFAAAVPICSSGNPSNAGLLVRLPIWCFHGDADPLVPVQNARDMIAAIKKAGGNPKYTEYPGVGHNSYVNAFKEPELVPWIFAQKRTAARTASTSSGNQFLSR